MKTTQKTSIACPAGIHVRSARRQIPCQYLVDSEHPRRREVEQFIARRFLDAHGARVCGFLPTLIAIFDGDRVAAAVGIRDAGLEPLFLEHYLDSPVEQAIATHSQRFRLPPDRNLIVEIGNLASIDRNASRRLFAVLARHLVGQGYEWAVFTGCSSLHRLFQTLGIKTVGLGRALQSRLPAQQQTWGSYYEDKPMVVAGQVSRGYRAFDGVDSDTAMGAVS